MSPFVTAAVAVRRLLARRPWVYWTVVALIAVGVAASMLQRADAVDAERAAWGETVTVFVATHHLAPGDPMSVEALDIPRAFAPSGHITADATDAAAIARQHIGAGEIVSLHDVVALAGPQALVPPGWLGVPVVESPRSGAAVGDRVVVVSDSVVVSDDALVVGRHDEVTIVAVPAGIAPAVPAAAETRSLTLLLVP